MYNRIIGGKHDDMVVLFDPGLSNLNRGDEIISTSALEFLSPVLNGRYVVHLSTHQSTSFRYMRNFSNAGAGFVLGSNLLKSRMLCGYRQWNVSLIDTLQIKNLILMGCGWQTYDSSKTDYYTKMLYRKLLSTNYLHSVRDDYTKNKLADIGIRNAINTGCPTLWKLNEEFCSHIRTKKGEIAVTTVTDYNRDSERDWEMLEILKSNYSHVFVWIQGSGDLPYLQELDDTGTSIRVIGPTLHEYDSFLEKHPEADYIGTRLHGGIRALQHGNRSLIIAIDNRAREMGRDYNLPVFERDCIYSLKEKICRDIQTRITLNQRAIDTYLLQLEDIASSLQ